MTRFDEIRCGYLIAAKTDGRIMHRLLTNLKIIAIVFLSVIVGGCFGPLVSHDTARTVGNGKTSFKAIATNISSEYYGFKLDHGFGDNLDLGYSLETGSNGISAKYAFVNNARGSSFGAKVGYGSTFGGHYTLGSLLASYKGSNWEPYLNFQYVKVTIDEQDVKDSRTGDVFATTPKFDFNYTQAFIGTKYWFTPHFALSLEFSDFVDNNDVNLLKANIVSLSADFSS